MSNTEWNGDEEVLAVEPVEVPDRIVPLTNEPHKQTEPRSTFAQYKTDARTWITLITGEYYPDILAHANNLYAPVLVQFGEALRISESSSRLLLNIASISPTWMRVQVARVFRKYVSPETPVEMLKQKNKAEQITEEFGDTFRPIQEVQKAFESRPLPDEALCAVLWEYKDRGKKGYDLTTRLFDLLRESLPGLRLSGPERAGKDILLSSVFPNYPNKNRPVDFVIHEGNDVLAIGLARYDGDRGGAQEDDRTGGYKNCADEIFGYCDAEGFHKIKMLFINDGPGLLLGSMWNDYASIENRYPNRIRVVTLRMVPERITTEWLRS